MEKIVEQKIMELIIDIVKFENRIWEVELQLSNQDLSDLEVSINEDVIFAYKESLKRKKDILELFVKVGS